MEESRRGGSRPNPDRSKTEGRNYPHESRGGGRGSDRNRGRDREMVRGKGREVKRELREGI